MGFELLKDDTVYLETRVETGSYVSGTWVEGDDEITYTAFDGLSEPNNKAISSFVLPTGVKNSETMFLYTSEDLYTHSDIGDSARVASIVYLENPETNTSALPYVVFDKEPWGNNAGYQLFDTNDYLYILIRQDKLTT